MTDEKLPKFLAYATVVFAFASIYCFAALLVMWLWNFIASMTSLGEISYRMSAVVVLLMVFVGGLFRR
jgi:hypothetical protein